MSDLNEWLNREYVNTVVTVDGHKGIGLVQSVERDADGRLWFSVYLHCMSVRVLATQCQRYRHSQRLRAQG